MTSIGIRELRQNASKYIALVKQGETIEITDHGQPVAVLSPLPPPAEETGFERLVRLGIVTPAKVEGGVAGLIPIPMRPGERPLSEILAEMREDERF